VAIAIGALGASPLWARPTEPTAAGAPTSDQPEDVRTIFLRDCATCHGADARGTTTGPSLASAGRALVDFELTTGRMPLHDPDDEPERKPPAYSSETIAALVDYVSSLAPGGPDIPAVDVAAGQIPRGGEIYRAQCAACHEWAGEGGALLDQDAPSVHAATAVQIAEAVRAGPGNMPVFPTAAVSDAELNDLVAYVESLRHPDDRGGAGLWHLGPLAEGAVALAALGLVLVALRAIGSRQ
jgi:ubiquinol-cytochrome c reductase cytochrome c subunit